VAVKSNSASSSQNPKHPPSSPKPPAFIGKPRGRCHHLPFGAFSIDDLALIKVISADLDFLHSYPPMLMVGQPRKPDPFQTY
jgi:hypothetical protein